MKHILVCISFLLMILPTFGQSHQRPRISIVASRVSFSKAPQFVATSVTYDIGDNVYNLNGNVSLDMQSAKFKRADSVFYNPANKTVRVFGSSNVSGEGRVFMSSDVVVIYLDGRKKP
jgi:hypothetical protein